MLVEAADTATTALVSPHEIARDKNLRAALVFREDLKLCGIREASCLRDLATIQAEPIRDCHPVTPADGPVPVILILSGFFAGLAFGALAAMAFAQ